MDPPTDANPNICNNPTTEEFLILCTMFDSTSSREGKFGGAFKSEVA
jgi:hypothetical protein